MRTMFALLALALFAGQASAQGQYGGFVFNADIAARRITATPPALPDIPSTTGYTRFRTEGGNNLIFQSSLNQAVDITAVHLHLSTPRGAVDNAPLVIALTNTSALSSQGTNPLVQNGQVGNAQLLANPQLQAARDAIRALGINDNALANIGDVDRLGRAGLLYSDVHSVTRPSPNRVGSGIVTVVGSGKRLRFV